MGNLFGPVEGRRHYSFMLATSGFLQELQRLDFKKNLIIGLSAVGKMYVTCALMQNAHCILYSSVTSEYFGLNPPTLEEYFI